MTIRFFIVATLILVFRLAGAQPIELDPIHESGYILINKQVEYIKTYLPISFDSATSEKRVTDYRKIASEHAQFVGYDPNHYWFRFEVRNNDSVRHDVALLLAQIGIREVQIFQQHNGNWKTVGLTGYKYPFSSRPIPFTHYAIPLTIEANSTDWFYITIDETHAFKVIAFALLHPRKLQMVMSDFYFLFGFLVGVMLLFFLFNIYLYISTRDRIHAWYGVYIFLQTFLLIKQHGLDAQFLGLDFENGYRATTMAAVGLLAIGVLIHVIQLFLLEINKVKWLAGFTVLLKMAIFLISIVQFIVFYIQPEHRIELVVFELVNKSSIVGLVFILLVCCYALFKGNKLAILLVIALSIYLMGGLERLLFLPTYSYFFPPSLLEIGIVMEAVLISFGLMLRYNEYRKDKLRLVDELAVEKINQQQKIEASLKVDRERIKQDLHDSLGGKLSSISMGLSRLGKDNNPATVESIQDVTDKAMAELRDSLWILDKESVSMMEIEQRINVLFWQYRKMETPVDLSIVLEESLLTYRMSAANGGNLFRIIQEATHNCIKHSQATQFCIAIEKVDKKLRIVMTDNGVGFSPVEKPGGEHYGVKNMKKRSEQMNAQLSIETSLNGTAVTLIIPLA